MLAVDAGTIWSAVAASTVVSAVVVAATSLLGQRWEFTRRLRLARADEARRYRDLKANRVREGVRLLVKALHLVDRMVGHVERTGGGHILDSELEEVLRLFEVAQLELSLDDEAKPLLDLFDQDAFRGLQRVQILFHQQKEAVAAAKGMPGRPDPIVASLAAQIEAQLQQTYDGIKGVAQACRDVLRALEDPVEP
jgi:hypothetical protein